MNKRGSDQTIWIIIALIIGGVVLFLFSSAISSQFNRLQDFFRTNNVNIIQQKCDDYCENNQWSFCYESIELIKSRKVRSTGTCNDFSKTKNENFIGLIEPCPKASCFPSEN